MKTCKKIYAWMLVAAVLLSSCFVVVSAAGTTTVTLDFENNSQGEIIVENSLLNGDGFSDPAIQAGFEPANTSQQLFAGHNNSLRFANYFDEAQQVHSFSVDMRIMGGNFLDSQDPSSGIRLFQLDANHRFLFGLPNTPEHPLTLIPYQESQGNTVQIPADCAGGDWCTLVFTYIGRTVYVSAKKLGTEELSAPAELCTLDAAPTDLVISSGYTTNVGSDIYHLPIDNVVIQYKDEAMQAFEQTYASVLDLTEQELTHLYSTDADRFYELVAALEQAVAAIDANTDFQACYAVTQVKLAALLDAAAALDTSIVTIDFEDGARGEITVSDSALHATAGFSDPVIQNGLNGSSNMQLFPGQNNSLHFANYFDEAQRVHSLSVDMRLVGGVNMNNGDPSSMIRVIRLDENHAYLFGLINGAEGNPLSFIPYAGTEGGTVNIPSGYAGGDWCTLVFTYVGRTVYVSAEKLGADALSAPVELCTLDTDPADLVISSGWVEFTDSAYSIPMDNIVIQYPNKQMQAFEEAYGAVLNLTVEQLEQMYATDVDQFRNHVAIMEEAAGAIQGDAALTDTYAALLLKLEALLEAAAALDSGLVTIDFEDGTRGEITVSDSALNAGAGFSDPQIQAGFNAGATQQLFPGQNNSLHFGAYFTKPVQSIALDMYINNAINMWDPSSLIRRISFDDRYSIDFGMESGTIQCRINVDGTWNVQQPAILSGCTAGWYTVVISYVGNTVYISAKAAGTEEALSEPVELCTLDAAPTDLVISTGWVEQGNSIYSLPIDNVVIEYQSTEPFRLSIENGAYIRTISENGFGNGISFKTVVTANENFDTSTIAELYYGTLAMDTEHLGTADHLLTYEMATVANSNGYLAKKAESSVPVTEIASLTDWRTSIVSSQDKGTTVLDFGNKNQTIRSFIRYRLTSDPEGSYRIIYSPGNSLSRSFYQTAINAYNANIEDIMDRTGITGLTPIDAVTEDNAITALYYLGQYGYELDDAIVSHAVYQALAAESQS